MNRRPPTIEPGGDSRTLDEGVQASARRSGMREGEGVRESGRREEKRFEGASEAPKARALSKEEFRREV